VVLSQSTKSSESIDLAARWLGKCLADHTKCHTSSESPSWHPTRLLDVGADLDSIVKLVLCGEKSDIQGPYATLSHCWGTEMPLRLTIDSLTAFQIEIPWSSIPRTFKDAVEVTRRLGVRYLWIDSLCIIQDGDDLKDWRHESNLMCEVYSNCLLNISALVGKDSTHGLFSMRAPHLVRPHIFQAKVTNRDGLLQEETFRLTDQKLWQNQIELSCLSTRAWYVQERLLAPRVIYFCSQQVCWECHETRAMESFPEGGRFWGTYSKTIDPLLESHSGETAWNVVVPVYSRALLTRPEDKVVAISGLAKMVQRKTGDQYLAGLRKKNLVRQLLWHVDRGFKPRHRPMIRPKTPRAPTFSWISIDSAVVFALHHRADGEIVADVLETHTDGAAINSGLDVKVESLSLKGFLVTIRLWADEPTIVFDVPERRWHIASWEGNSKNLQDKDEDVDGTQDVKREERFFELMDISREYNGPEIIYGVIIAIWEKERRVDGLLLEMDHASGLFKRIGYFWGFSNLATQLMAASPNTEELFSTCFDSTTGKHTIRII
jgi:hypothetical protein